MTKRTSLVAIAVALSLTAGCASRRTADQLPPEPVSSTDARRPAPRTAIVAGAAVPGSRADFLQSVPSDRVLFDSIPIRSTARTAPRSTPRPPIWRAYPNVRVTIEGHADERGTREYNLALGDRRANAARAYLESRGVARGRMQVISWGKERPQVPESNESRLGPEPPRRDGAAGIRNVPSASRLRRPQPGRIGLEGLVEQAGEAQAAARDLAADDRDQPPGDLLGDHRPLGRRRRRRGRPGSCRRRIRGSPAQLSRAQSATLPCAHRRLVRVAELGEDARGAARRRRQAAVGQIAVPDRMQIGRGSSRRRPAPGCRRGRHGRRRASAGGDRP